MGKDGVEVTPTTVAGEKQGPEDAFGKGVKRGDYKDRQDGSEHFEGDDDQNARVEEIGDTEGKKGGVDSKTEAEIEEEEA